MTAKKGDAVEAPPEAHPVIAQGEAARPIPLSRLSESPSQPRRGKLDPEKLAELVASIRSNGLLQPILVRPKGRGFEIVFGHRRAAAMARAGLEEIPAFVRELDDRTVLELQLEENLRRQDLHPAEEAEGYRQLVDVHGMTAEQIAARIGKSKGYVYGRLKLCALRGKARDAFLEGRVDATLATALARVPDVLQDEAFRSVEGRPYRDAVRVLLSDYTLTLASAPFDVADAELVKKAGACLACPKRTGNLRELFPDVRSADVCTDPVCFKAKAAASFERQVAAVPAEQVIPKTQAKKLFHGDRLTHGSGLVDLDAPNVLDALGLYGSSSTKSLRKLAGERLPTTAARLAQDENGAGHWLVPVEEAKAALRKAGVAKKELVEQQKVRGPSEDAKRRRAQKARVEAGLVAVRTCADKLLPLAAKVDRRLWAVVEAFVDVRAWHDAGKYAARAREEKAEGRLEVLDRMLATGIVTGSWSSETMSEPLRSACRELKVRPKAAKKKAGKKKKKAARRARKGAA